MSTASFVTKPFAHAFRKLLPRLAAATRNDNDNTAEMKCALILEAALRDEARTALTSKSAIHQKRLTQRQPIKPISIPTSKSVVGSGTADESGSPEDSA